MKNVALFTLVALCLALAPVALAQTNPQDESNQNNKNHGNIGAYFDYTRLQSQGLNMLGVGGRIGFNVRKNIVLEAEMAYDFERSKTQTFTAGSVTSTTTTNVRVLHALFGPKIQTKGPMRLFILAKAGLVNFGVTGPVPTGAINNQIGNILNGDVNTAIYPGGGVEFNIRRISFRAEAGDELMLLRGGTQNNFRATFGPQLRF
jgi:opacity protein-like surface antigen